MRIGFPKKTPAPIDQSCVLYYKMDEASGNIKDWSGGGNTGIVAGSPVYSQSGIFTNSIDLNDGGYVSSTSTSITADGTIILWVYPDTMASGERIMQKGTGARPSISFDGTLNFQFLAYNGTAFSTATSTFPASAGTWYHLACTWKEDDVVAIYINGKFEDDDPITGTIQAQENPFVFGRRGTINDSFFDGKMEEIRIYNRVLSASEIKEHYMRGR